MNIISPCCVIFQLCMNISLEQPLFFVRHGHFSAWELLLLCKCAALGLALLSVCSITGQMCRITGTTGSGVNKGARGESVAHVVEVQTRRQRDSRQRPTHYCAAKIKISARYRHCVIIVYITCLSFCDMWEFHGVLYFHPLFFQTKPQP